ncbi:MAG: FAD-dependent oxidoreductase [Catenulispora sp.]
MSTGEEAVEAAVEEFAADVVVCGSGVAGLAAALALDRLGVDVCLLDKQVRPAPVWKGEVLQPGSLATLHDWDVLARLEDRSAVRLRRLVARSAAGAELLAMDFGLLGGERPWMLAHDYPTILDCLGRALSPAVRVLRGVLATDVLTDAEGRVRGVSARQGARELRIRARLVVAADGMSSRLRKQSGIEVSPIAYDHRLLSFELPGVPELHDEVSAHVTERGLVMVYPLPADRTRVYVQVGPEEVRGLSEQELRAWCEALVQQVPALGPLAKTLEANLERRQLLPVWRYRAPVLVRPGLVLAGEAAHVVHPLAAQGMNTSIADARALAARLAGTELADPVATDAALRGYERDRGGRISDVHTMSHNAARMMTSTSRVQRLLGRRALKGTAGHPRLRHLVTYNMSGLGMRPLTTLDRLVQLGALPDVRARGFRAPG